MTLYILTALLFSADGSYSTMRIGEPVSLDDCRGQIADAYAQAYVDSVLTCEQLQNKGNGNG